jgi:hypothetical protein
VPASNLDEINGRLAETKAELARLDAAEKNSLANSPSYSEKRLYCSMGR